MHRKVPRSLCPYQKDSRPRDSPDQIDIEFADKKVVLVSVPGAFTGTCSEKHLPGYLANLSRLKENGVDKIAIIAYNDAYVMSAWAKAHGVQSEDVVSILARCLSFPKKKKNDPNEAVD